MSGAVGSDPAVVDRRTTSLIAVQDRSLPTRTMTIAGTDGRIEARILSKDQSGPASRLVRMPAGWGTGMAGSFDARLEVFVVSGALTLGADTLGEYDYALVERGRMLGGVRAESDTVALLMTDAPVRYDLTGGGSLTAATVGRSADVPWSAVAELPGRFSRILFSSPDRHIWLSGARQWSHAGPWHRHGAAEEMFVLDGALHLVEAGGATVEHGPGSYSYRLAGELHAGPGSRSSEMAIAFHRLLGPASLDWEGQPDIT